MHTNQNFDSNRYRRIAMTKHAQKRSAQRRISQDTAELIRTFGERTYDGDGGIRCLMTRAAVDRLVSVLGRFQRVDSLLGAYAVLCAEDESVVITVSHRH